MSPAKHSYGSVTDGRTDRQTDDGQSDPYVSLCFAGDTKNKIMPQRVLGLQCAYYEIMGLFLSIHVMKVAGFSPFNH